MDRPQPAYNGNEPFVFVSYSHNDGDVVYPEIRWLQDHGVNVWYDEGISGASRWRDAIAHRIASCSLFLLYVSPNSVASQVCREELEYALDQGCTILSIHVEDTSLPEGMRLGITNRQGLLRYQLSSEDYQAKLTSTITERLELGDITRSRPIPVRQPQARSRSALAASIGLLSGMGLTLLALQFAPETPSAADNSYHFDIALQSPLRFSTNEIGTPLKSLALSPDGESLVYVSIRENEQLLRRRSLKTGEDRVIEGTTGAGLPLISPDGDWLAYFVGNTLYKMPMAGGQSNQLATTENVNAAEWSHTGKIVITHDDYTTLTAVDPDQVAQATLTQASLNEDSLNVGTLLDEQRMLTSASGKVIVYDLTTGDSEETGMSGYVPRIQGDFILSYSLSGLQAARFNRETGKVISPVVSVPTAANKGIRDLNWDVGMNGHLAYAAGHDNMASSLPLLFASPQGAISALGYEPQSFGTMSISRDGATIAIARRVTNERITELWLFDIDSVFSRKVPIEVGSYIRNLVWLPNDTGLYITTPTGTLLHHLNTTTAELVDLGLDEPHSVDSIDPSGRWVIASTEQAFWLYDSTTSDTTLLFPHKGDWGGAVNPSGQGVAFVSRRSGSYQIYYKPFDGTDQIIQVSRDPGSEEPRFNHDGSRLYFRRGNRIMVTDVIDASTGKFGAPRTYFEGEFTNVGGRSYDITRDESQALIIGAPEGTSEVLHVETDWLGKVRRLIELAEAE